VPRWHVFKEGDGVLCRGEVWFGNETIRCLYGVSHVVNNLVSLVLFLTILSFFSVSFFCFFPDIFCC